MSDEQKQASEEKPEAKQSTEETTEKAQETKPEPEVLDEKNNQEGAESDNQKEEEKTTLEIIEEETEKGAKSKKVKGAYEEIKPEHIKQGMLIRVHQKIVDTNSKGEEKERVQIFQGMVLAKKHGSEAGATITVRKMSGSIGVEKIYPLSMPSITKLEIVRTYRTRQAKPYYLRTTKKRLKEIKK